MSQQDVSRAIIASLFSTNRETGAAANESYVSHVKTYEPDQGPAGRKERFLIISAGRDSRLRLHKAKQNSNGTFSIGKTWNLEDLRGIEVVKIRIQGSPQPQPLEFILSFSGPKNYRYETGLPSSQQAAFLVTLVRCWRKFISSAPSSITANAPHDLILVGFSVDSSSTASSQGSSSRQQPPSVQAGLPPPSRDRYGAVQSSSPNRPTQPPLQPHQAAQGVGLGLNRVRSDGPPPLAQPRRPVGANTLSSSAPARPAQAPERTISPPTSSMPPPSSTRPRMASDNAASNVRPPSQTAQQRPQAAPPSSSAAAMPAPRAVVEPLKIPRRQMSEDPSSSSSRSKSPNPPMASTPTRSESMGQHVSERSLASRSLDPSAADKASSKQATKNGTSDKSSVPARKTPSPSPRRHQPEELFDDDTVLSNVEEMLEGFEWRAGAYIGGQQGRGKADEIEKQLVGELKALEAASIHAIMESDDRVAAVTKDIDQAIAELEKMDLLLGMFKTSLNMMNDDIAHIEGQNRGLQVQMTNQRGLLSEIENLMETTQVADQDLVALTKESLESQTGIEHLEKAASNLYKAILSMRDTGVGELAVASERIEEYRTKAGQFCKRVFDFLSIMFKFQAEQVKNPKDASSATKGKALTLPSHGQMEDYLGRYCGLMLFVKEIDLQRYQQICAAYFAVASELYRSETREMMSSLRLLVRKATEDELEANFSAVKDSPNLRQQGLRRAGTLVKGQLESSKTKDQSGKISGGEAFGRALDQITSAVIKEQAFVLEFLHITPLESSITFADYMALETFFHRSATTWLATQKGQLKDIRSAMDQVFSFLETELKDWIDAILRADPMQVVGVLVALDRAILKCQEDQNEFLQRSLQRQYQKSTSTLEQSCTEQIKAIEQTKLTLKKRKGVVPFVRVFPLFVERFESQLEGADHLRVRKTIDGHYERYVKTIFDCLQQMAKMDGETQVVQGEDKGLLNYHVILVENMHHVTTVFASYKVPVLAAFVSQAKHKYNENLDLYIKLILRRPFGRVMDFFGGLEQLLRTTPPTEVSLHAQYSKSALRRAVSEARQKDIRKAVDALYKRVDKHFGDVLNPSAEHADVIKTVWKACEEETVKMFAKWRSLIERCYPDEKQTLEIKSDDTVGEYVQLGDATTTTPTMPLDVVKHYTSLLEQDNALAMPIAAIACLAEVVARCTSSTTAELLELIRHASRELAEASYAPCSLNCGTSLFMRFLILQRPPPELSFIEFKNQIVERAREFVRCSGNCREAIAEHTADFITDEATILVHSYSRVVVQALLYAAQTEKKRFRVYVTEARPFGLGLKTHAVLTDAGIECTVLLDSAVSYVMSKVDMCIVGAEAVCESGGLINFIGGYQMAIAAKANGKPLYALAEAYKFTRLFPFGQDDLPTSVAQAPLSFREIVPGDKKVIPPTPQRPMLDSPMPQALQMTDDMVRSQPVLDYTTPDLVTLIISDLGPITPSGVSDALLGIFGGE